MILFIGGNIIGDEGAKAIGASLINNSTLTNLHLGMCSFLLFHCAYNIIHRLQ